MKENRSLAGTNPQELERQAGEAEAGLRRKIELIAKRGSLPGRSGIDAAVQAAFTRLLHNAQYSSEPLTRQGKLEFLLAIGAGFPISVSAELVGVSEATLYREKKADPRFAELWEQAFDQSTETIEHKLAYIALEGDIGSMATVRAAETVLRGRNARYRQTQNGQASVTTPDGETRTIKWSNRAPLPD